MFESLYSGLFTLVPMHRGTKMKTETKQKQ